MFGEWLANIIAYGGGISAVIFLCFKAFGEKWLESHFSGRIDSMRHAHALELEARKHELNLTLATINKLNDKEFEVVPSAWGLLCDCYFPVRSAINAFQQSPDISGLKQEQLDRLFEKEGFDLDAIEHVMNATDKQSAFSRVREIKALNSAGMKYQTFKDYVDKNTVFMTESIASGFDNIIQLLRSALFDRQFTLGPLSESAKIWRELSQKAEQADSLFKELQGQIRNRMRERAGLQ